MELFKKKIKMLQFLFSFPTQQLQKLTELIPKTEILPAKCVCLQSGNTSRHPGICLSRYDASAASRHYGEGRVRLGDGLSLPWSHLPHVYRFWRLHARHNWVSEIAKQHAGFRNALIHWLLTQFFWQLLRLRFDIDLTAFDRAARNQISHSNLKSFETNI